MTTIKIFLILLVLSVTSTIYGQTTGQAGNLGVNIYCSNLTSTGSATINRPHLSISNTNQLTSAGTTNVNLIPWTNIDVQNNAGSGVWSTNGSKIYFPTNGAYHAVLSVIFRTGATEGGNARVWLRQNGNDVTRSGTHLDFPTVSGGGTITNMSQVVAVPFDIQTAVGDWIEFAWWSDTADTVLPSYSIGANPTRAASPAVILTIDKTSSQ